MPSTIRDLPLPLPYMARVRNLLKEHEPEVWSAIAGDRIAEQEVEAIRLDLLKRAYRLSPEGEADHYAMAAEVAERLEIAPRITLYQHGGADTNAMLFYIAGEAHIVFYGNLLKQLAPEELRSVIAHELGHYRLYEIENGDHYVTRRMLSGAARHAAAAPAHFITDARYQRAMELYADRCALSACGDLEPVISGLLKVHVGLDKVNVPAYLKQAEEVLAKEARGNAHVDHPEMFIRARALALWQADPTGCEPEIQRMLDDVPNLEKLDLPGQYQLAETTERFLAAILAPAWLRTDAILGQIRVAFPDFRPEGARLDDVLADIKDAPPEFGDYFHYLLLDIATADPDLDDAPMAWAMTVAEKTGRLDAFEKLARKELKQTRKALMAIHEKAERLLADAAAQHAKGGQS